MDIETWKAQLVSEIETAAEWRAEQAVVDRDDPAIAESQSALFELASRIRALSADQAELQNLYKEEMELANLDRATPGEAESRYREAKEDLLRAIGFEHEPFGDTGRFLGVLRRQVDETISEFRLA